MAHAAQLDALAQKLVTTTTHVSQHDPRFPGLRQVAVHGISDRRHVRTNQFTVQHTLAGLLEKFVVLNRDDLAEALQDRLDQLPANNKWLPDILAFLLLLSDRPAEKTHLKDVEALDIPPTPRCEVTWEQILAEEPLDEEGIWDNVDRGYHSSGDDTTADDGIDSENTTSTIATSVDEDLQALAKLHLAHPDPSLLDDILAFRQHRQSPAKHSEVLILSELTLIRETICMLNGLPSLLYQQDEASRALHIHADATIERVAALTMRDFLHSCADMGTNINFLRKWSSCKHDVAHLESMQAAVEELLCAFQRELTIIERRYVCASVDTCVSVLKVWSELENLVRPLAQLSTLIRQHQTSVLNGVASFTLLNGFYNQACILRLVGDEASFTAVAQILWASFVTYLRSVNSWIRSGHIPAECTDTFFVMDANSDCTPGRIWQDRFTLRTSNNGETLCPSLMEGFVHRIASIGKAKAFLKLLDPAIHMDSDTDDIALSFPTFNDVQQQLAESPLLPFPQLIEDILDKWLISTQIESKFILRDTIMEKYGLRSALMAVPYVFFAKDGTLFQSFAEPLFRRISHSPDIWQGSSFFLTELAQNTLGSASEVDPESIAVLLQPQEKEQTGLQLYITQKLSTLRLKYVVSWPAQNIIQYGTLKVLSAAFVLLLQIYHAKRLLRPQLFAFRMCRAVSSSVSKTLAAAIQLRFRLVNFVDILMVHITTTTSSQSRVMHSRMEIADGIDDMANIWTAYVQRLQTVLLLSPNLKSMKNAVLSILVSCEQFAKMWQEFMPSLPTSSQDSSSPAHAYPRNVDISTVEQEIDKHLSFIKAGLRGVSRASGEAALEALAERLE